MQSKWQAIVKYANEKLKEARQRLNNSALFLFEMIEEVGNHDHSKVI